MPGYRRFIAYVYAYDQGKKGDGKGFIKVEARNGICRMNFKLQGTLGRDSVCAKIYGYVREGQNSRGILLGNRNLAGNQAEFELEMEEDHMGGSSYSLENLGGLLILGENGEVYASGWDDQPVRPENVQLPEKETLEEELPESGPALPEETAREISEEDGTEEAPEIEESLDQKEIQKPEEEEVLEEEAGYAEAADMEEEKENIRLADALELESQSAAEERDKFSPFPDEEITDCRKISMSEIRNLGRRDQGLINNSFLRYGMKNYGHLLLGIREEDGRYILGVPGIYERQESLMATMFGFPYFKECRNPGGKRGRFGYWYRFIDPPQF